MKKFLFIFGFMLLGSSQGIIAQPPSDFDKFLEELFGAPAPAGPAEEPSVKPAQEELSPAQRQRRPPFGYEDEGVEKVVEKEETAEEIAKKKELRQQVSTNLSQIKQLLGFIIPAVEHEIFSSKLQERVGKAEKSAAAKLEALVDEIRSEELYIDTIVEKRRRGLQNNIASFVDYLSPLNKMINTFFLKKSPW